MCRRPSDSLETESPAFHSSECADIARGADIAAALKLERSEGGPPIQIGEPCSANYHTLEGVVNALGLWR